VTASEHDAGSIKTGSGMNVRIYVAGPLFSVAERRFNVALTARLEGAGFSVFLPQRDGAERDRPPYASMTREERRAAMFALDTAEILACGIFLIILDGRVPDEGAAFELGVAYTCKLLQQPAKRLIGLHTDARAAFIGAKLNPMLAVPLDALFTDEDALLQALVGGEVPVRKTAGAGDEQDPMR
jgi:nucleoside 2-deoxyribosyltransferase